MHLVLTMIAKDYMAPTGYKFLLPHSPRDYPPKMGTKQEQALRTDGSDKTNHFSEDATPWTEH